MRNLMVDIETMGTKSNSAIISIGAQFFCMETGNLGSSLHQTINLQSNIASGLKVDANTALWWLGQEGALESWALSKKADLGYTLKYFSEFLENTLIPNEIIIWGNSNRFDMGLLENAYSALGREIPWNFRNERDVRTLTAFDPDTKLKHIAKAKEEGVMLHNALEDCKLQIKYCVEIYNKLRIDV